MRGARRRASSPNHRLRTSLALSLGLHLLLGAVILEGSSHDRLDASARQAPAPVLRLRLLPSPPASRQPEQGARGPASARALEPAPAQEPAEPGRARRSPSVVPRSRESAAKDPAAKEHAAKEHAAKEHAGPTAAGRSAAREQAPSRPVASVPPASAGVGSAASAPIAGISTRSAVDAAVADPRWQLRQRDFPPPPDAMSRAVVRSARPPCYGPSAPIRPGGLLAIPGLIYDMAEGNCSR